MTISGEERRVVGSKIATYVQPRTCACINSMLRPFYDKPGCAAYLITEKSASLLLMRAGDQKLICKLEGPYASRGSGHETSKIYEPELHALPNIASLLCLVYTDIIN